MSSRTIPNTMGYDVVPYNRDNQRTGTGFRHDGNGNPVDYAGGTFVAGTAFSYDAENRLTQIISPSAPAQNLSAAYGYDNLRAWRETAIQGKLFFLYDETGFSQTPLLELSVSGSVISANGFAADGWRGRYYPQGSNGYNAWYYSFDPQGNLVQRKAEGYTTWPVYDTVLYDAYGMSSGDFWTFANQGSPHKDPVGFGGQWGYFTEWETKPNTTADAGTSLLLLSHRYYDPATGRFVNRDPIGYDGGINLYTFAGGNPVNRIDPDGTDDFALLSTLPPSPSRKVSWLEHWHQKIVNALSSPGWQIGMIQGQIEQQNQFDQMVAMRQMQEEERDANTASAVGFVDINNPANNAFYVIGMLKDTLRYRNKAGFVVAPDLGADWNLMKNREWVAEGARGGKRFLLVTPISEINEAIEKGTGGLYTRFELTLLRNKYPSTPVLKGYKSKIAGEKVKGKF